MILKRRVIKNRMGRICVAVALAALSVGFSVSTAAAQDDDADTEPVHVVQDKPVLQGQRLEFAPRFGMSVNDSVYRSAKVGGNLNYHFVERAYIGATFDWYDFDEAIGGRTDIYETTTSLTNTAPDAPVLNYFGALEGGFIPISGKFSLFNVAILYFDLGFSLGAGYVDAESIAISESEGTWGLTGSIFSRLYINDWLGLNFELRDVLYPGQVRGGGGVEDTIVNNVSFAAGFSIYLPPSFEYSD
jgi:outer membrane beta-barrel protein